MEGRLEGGSGHFEGGSVPLWRRAVVRTPGTHRGRQGSAPSVIIEEGGQYAEKKSEGGTQGGDTTHRLGANAGSRAKRKTTSFLPMPSLSLPMLDPHSYRWQETFLGQWTSGSDSSPSILFRPLVDRIISSRKKTPTEHAPGPLGDCGPVSVGNGPTMNRTERAMYRRGRGQAKVSAKWWVPVPWYFQIVCWWNSVS